MPNVFSIDARGTVLAIPEKCDTFIYHEDCPDGLAAAWCARRKLGDKITLLPYNHGPNIIPPDVSGKNVVIADYSFDAETTKKMIKEAASFVVLDHHASAMEKLEDIPPEYKVFTMAMSGATLSWCYFFPGEPVPLWLRYVEDKDIWRWVHPHSREYSAGADLNIKTFEDMDRLHEGGQEAIDALITEGKVLQRYIQKVVDRHVRKSQLCTLKGFPQYTAAVVNSSVSASEIGNAICVQVQEADYAIIWQFDSISRQYIVSLRSNTDEVDVSKIAQTYGGGGHRRASGFVYSQPNFFDQIEFINKGKTLNERTA